jgi:hypothetical protein
MPSVRTKLLLAGDDKQDDEEDSGAVDDNYGVSSDFDEQQGPATSFA